MGKGSAGGRPGSKEPSTNRPQHASVVVVTDELFDVDPAVAKRATFAIGLGDLGLEGDDAFEPVLNYYWITHRRTPCAGQVCLTSFSLSRTS